MQKTRAAEPTILVACDGVMASSIDAAARTDRLLDGSDDAMGAVTPGIRRAERQRGAGPDVDLEAIPSGIRGMHDDARSSVRLLRAGCR